MRPVLSALAALVFVTVTASARAEGGHPLAERRVLFPNLIGFTVRTTDPGAGGALTSLDGLVSWSLTDDAAVKSHVESFAVTPSLDVRIGRFTVGAAVLFGQTTSTWDGGELHGSVAHWRLGFEPRLGVLVPLGRRLALWPRARFGVAAARTRAEGFGGVGGSQSALGMSGDVLLLVELGAGFFVSFGPSAGWTTTHTEADLAGTKARRTTSFQLAAGLGVGVAF